MGNIMDITLPAQSLTVRAQRISGPSARGGCETAVAPSQAEILSFMSVHGQACSLIPPPRSKQIWQDATQTLENAADVSKIRKDWPDEKIRAALRAFSRTLLEKPDLPPSMGRVLRVSHSDNTTTAQAQLPYFFYGASMFPSVLWALYRDALALSKHTGTAQVTVQPLPEFTGRFSPAVLPAHCLRPVRNKSTPACIEITRLEDSQDYTGNSVATGMLVFADEDILRDKIHTFQASGYKLKRVRVWVDKSDHVQELEALTYVWDKSIADLGEGQWNITAMLQDPWLRGIIKHPSVQQAEDSLS